MGQSTAELELTLGLVVDKVRVSETGDYNLSGGRYREYAHSARGHPMVSLGDTGSFRIESGGTPKSEVGEFWNGGIPWATLVDLPANEFLPEIRSTKRTISELGLSDSAARMIPADSVIVSTRATVGRIGLNRVPIATNQGFKNVVVVDKTRVLPEYVALALTRLVPTMEAWATGGTFKELSKTKFCELEIPVPPVDVQDELVGEVVSQRAIIRGAQTVIDNYVSHVVAEPDWPRVELGDVAALASGGISTKD